MTFQHVKPLRLPVSDIVIDEQALRHNTSQPDSFAVPVEDSVRAYLRRKFESFGGDKKLHIVVEEASVSENFEESEHRIASFLNVAGFEVYTVTLRLHIFSRALGGAQRGVKVKAGRVIKISEHASVAERERAQFEGMETMFRELDMAVTRIVMQDLNLMGLPEAHSGFDDPDELLRGGRATPLYEYETAPNISRSKAIERQEL